MRPGTTSPETAPSWTLVSIRTAFLQAAAGRLARRASQLGDLGSAVRPLRGFQPTNRLRAGPRADPAMAWARLDELEAILRTYDTYLSDCEHAIAKRASRERALELRVSRLKT